MKRFFVVMAIALTSVGALRAYEFPGFEWTVGADVVSSYLWRGMNYGGLGFQPDVMVGYGGAFVEAWANISPADYTFKDFAPELDITIGYKFSALTVAVNHQYYFDGSKYFDYRVPNPIDFAAGEYGGAQTDLFAKLEFGEWFEKVPLTIMWSTFVGGDDYYLTDAGKVKKAYSSYIEASYDIDLPLGFTLTPTIGMTPWKSIYNFYEGNFSVNNLALKLNWEFEVFDHFALDIYAMGSLNTYGLDKNNVVTKIGSRYNEDNTGQHLNGCIGLGLWFY